MIMYLISSDSPVNIFERKINSNFWYIPVSPLYDLLTILNAYTNLFYLESILKFLAILDT